jgi:hypothetical protein
MKEIKAPCESESRENGRVLIRREFGTRDKEGTEERKERLFY